MAFVKGQTAWNKNKKLPPLTEIHKNKIKESCKNHKWNGIMPPSFKGKHHSKSSKIKISNTLTELFKNPENHSRWKGGKSFEIYPIEWEEDLKESIRKRDNYTCQMSGCGIHQEELNGRFKKLDVHHIDYDKFNLNPDNLITLCRGCHSKTNGNREYWIVYFSEF